MQPLTRKVFIITVLFALAVGFASGYSYDNIESGNLTAAFKQLVNKGNKQPENVDFTLFWEVWDSLHEKYVDTNKLDVQKLVYGAISGMVNSVGDPYTVFFEPKISKKFEEEISGAFSGVGMEIGKRNDILTVISPIKDSPAFRAGIKAGDKILKVDGKSTAELSVEEAVTLIRGKQGTKVTITISSGTTTKDVPLTRDVIKIPAVQWTMRDGNTAHLEVLIFNSNVDAEFKKAAQEILKSSADSLVIDLRNNPGGLLDSAVNLAGWFMDKNSLVTTEKFGDGSQNEFRSSGDGQLKKYPAIVLINGGSASASEILAGALHDNRDLQLIGEKSFGKGSVQQLEKYVDGSSLKVTVAKWLTPGGISISDTGISPDIEVKIDQEDIESGAYVQGEPGKDAQLDRALELLK